MDLDVLDGKEELLFLRSIHKACNSGLRCGV